MMLYRFILYPTSAFIRHYLDDITLSRSDFHVPGQNFSAQPGGQVGGGGGSIGVPGGRGPPLGGVQLIDQTTSVITSGISTTGQIQIAPGSNIQSQPTQGPTVSATSVHNLSVQEMGKPTHLQNQPPTVQQVYIQNSSRSTSQNYYPTGPRTQQPRSLTHRGAQPGNQNQVVGMPGVGGASGQPTAIYPHPSITMQPSTMYVQGQVSGLHTNPHQQNIYSMNNQMPMQYSGPPQRHQTNQNQFQYQPYQTHALLTSNLFGYAHGAQHPGYFFHQPPNAPLNINRSNANTVNNGNQHMSGPLTGAQAATIVPQGTLQQSQQAQAMHSMSISLPQTDVYSGFNNSLGNVSTRSKKPRTKAITDIVNPNTGKNISAEIYKDDITTQSGESSNRESPQSLNCNADLLVADFAARVAKLASESASSSSIIEIDNRSVCSQVKNQNLVTVRSRLPESSKINQYNHDSIDSRKSITGSTLQIEQLESLETDLQSEKELASITADCTKPILNLLSSVSKNLLSEENDSIITNTFNIQVLPQREQKNLPEFENQLLTTDSTSVIKKTEVQLMHPHHENKQLEKTNSEIQIINKTLPTLITAHNLEDVYEKSNGETSMKPLETDIQKTDDQQKCVEGKTMQKQKNKNKVKSRELNRRGAEKEGTDMDAFVHPIQVSASSVKIEMKHDSLLQKDINKDENSESTKNIEDSDNYEFLKEKNLSEIDPQSVQKNITSLDEDEKSASAIQKEISLKNNNKESILEDALVNAHITKDCEHISIFRTNVDKEIVPSIVAQKNEENSKISGLGSVLKDSDICSNTLKSVSTPVITKTIPLLKYTYSDDQWSPINTNGKKIYGREFLMKLQNDPNSKAKPSNLPDLDVVLDSTKIRSPVDLWFKDSNLGRHDSLFPGFVKSSVNTKVSTSIKQKHISKPKTNKPNMIHLSFSREDVKLRETENAWKPRRLVQGSVSEEQTKTEALYKRVRSVLNKLTPQKFSTLVNQVRELEIDTQEKLQGVIDLVFEKAVDEPNFSVAYALMCKELSNMQVAGADSEDCTVANFRKLILTRCQSEFEKNTLDENARNEKLKEVEECADLERKKELQINFDEEERRIRVKSLGNIRFIGELFKQNMLTSKIMYQCIRHLLKQVDEENLECLCKLLTTIGKVLESKTADLSEYFKQMQQIANRKGKISSRIRFMLQDVIDLRGNKWIPRRDDSNPKTMDQIQREAESERLDIQLSNASLNTPRKDERVNERKRNRGAVGSMEEGGWSQPVGRTRQVYSVEAAKLKNKPPSMDDMQLGSRSTYQWLKPKMTTPNKFAYLEKVTAEPDKRVPSIHLSGSKSTGSRDYVRPEYKSNYDGRSSRNGTYQINTSSYNRDNTMVESTRSQSLSLISSSKFPSQTSSATNIPELSEEQLKKAVNSFIEEYVAEEEQNVDEGVKVFSTIFSITSHISFIHETINTVFEKSDYHQKKTSQLFAQLLYHNCISLLDFRTGLGAVLEVAGDLIIDIPRLWKYFANILVYPVINDSYCLTDLYTTIHHLLPKLRCKDHAAELFAELLLELVTLKEIEWVNQKWSQSGIHWHDLLDNRTKVDKFIIDHKLDFLLPDKTIDVRSFEVQHESISGLNIEKIHDKLLPLLKNSNFDEICGWIQTNVGDKIKEPKFIRILMTAILETSVEQCNDKWTFKRENFDKLQKLIQRYVDAEDDLELQCLFAVQEYITKLSHPAGLIVKIMTCLYENNVLSNEAFLTWEKNEDPAERKGKSVSLVSLKSFFIPLKEVEDISSGEEV